MFPVVTATFVVKEEKSASWGKHGLELPKIVICLCSLGRHLPDGPWREAGWSQRHPGDEQRRLGILQVSSKKKEFPSPRVPACFATRKRNFPPVTTHAREEFGARSNSHLVWGAVADSRRPTHENFFWSSSSFFLSLRRQPPCLHTPSVKRELENKGKASSS